MAIDSAKCYQVWSLSILQRVREEWLSWKSFFVSSLMKQQPLRSKRSKSQNGIAMAYCGSLFVDHCPAEKLFKHFFGFFKKIGLDIKFMLHLGMDGPNMNLKLQRLIFQSSLWAEAKHHFWTLDLAHCILCTMPLEKLSHSWSSMLINLLWTSICQLHADYKSMVEFTDVVSQYALKHSTTRWMTMRKVVVRLIEQYDNLKSQVNSVELSALGVEDHV